MCAVLLPPGDNPIAVNKYIISYHIISYMTKLIGAFAVSRRRLRISTILASDHTTVRCAGINVKECTNIHIFSIEDVSPPENLMRFLGYL